MENQIATNCYNDPVIAAFLKELKIQNDAAEELFSLLNYDIPEIRLKLFDFCMIANMKAYQENM